ncbi:MAG: hypothetical protein HQK53_16275 [Oligoflexia bacterium]|nr:hypothetical protein [Oligoflexia bacterium]
MLIMIAGEVISKGAVSPGTLGALEGKAGRSAAEAASGKSRLAGSSSLPDFVENVIAKRVAGSGGKVKFDKQKNGTPGNNQAQNKQTHDAAKAYNLTKDQQRILHDQVSGQNYSYQELKEIARRIKEEGLR